MNVYWQDCSKFDKFGKVGALRVCMYVIDHDKH